MNRFEKCRREKGYTQKYVAMTIGVKPPQISKWEAGTQSPSRENVIKLAELFNVSSDYLLGITDDPSRIHETNQKPPIVSTDVGSMPGDPDYTEKNIQILSRSLRQMNQEEQAQLMAVFRVMFANDFDAKGNRRE